MQISLLDLQLMLFSLPRNPEFSQPRVKHLLKHCEETRKCCYQHFLLFPICFQPFQRQKIFILPISFCRLQMI